MIVLKGTVRNKKCSYFVSVWQGGGGDFEVVSKIEKSAQMFEKKNAWWKNEKHL